MLNFIKKAKFSSILTAPLKLVRVVTKPITRPVEKLTMDVFKAIIIKFLKEAAYAAIPALIAGFEALKASVAGADPGNTVAGWVLVGVAALAQGVIRALIRLSQWDPLKVQK